MIREETVFGPIHSRRLGSSLGINLLPRHGKICNFDCIYCECGCQCLLDGTRIDSITFSGDGEPTLNPEFPRIIDDTLKLRDAYFPSAKVSVLSNATRVHIPEVAAALRRVDNPILKIDAPTDGLVGRINHPAPGYSLERVLEALRGFGGDFVLQTMFLRSPDFDSAAPEVLDGWMKIVRDLRPRKIMVYTIDRPTPQEGLQKFTPAEMRALVQPLLDEGFNIDIKG